MKNLRFEIPASVDEISENGNIAKFSIKPLERGYGITVGNALRRVLLASMPGAAIVNIQIDGIEHEFSTIEGVYEDVMGIILNLKEIVFKVDNEDPNFSQVLELEVEDKEVVTAGDFKLFTGTEIINPDLVICHLMKNTKFRLQAELRLGIGYVSSDDNKQFNKYHGQIAIDSIFTPIKRVTYHVEKIRGDKDELQLEVETNGAIKAKDALGLSANILIEHLEFIRDISEKAGQVVSFSTEQQVEEHDTSDLGIEELGITVRLYNSLKKAGIYTVKQLLQKNDGDIRKIRGLGQKSSEELKRKLEELRSNPKAIYASKKVDLNDKNDDEDLDLHEEK